MSIISHQRPLSMSQLPQRKQEPLPIATNYGFTPQNMPKVACHYHNKESITYFCKETQLPLCHLCVPIHQNELKQKGMRSNIIPLEASLIEAYSQLSTQANELTFTHAKLLDLQNNFSRTSLGDKTSLITNPIQMIESAKQQVHSIVDNYFNTLVTFIKARVPEHIGRVPDTTRLTLEMRSRWEQIVKDIEALNSSACLESLIHFYQGTSMSDNERALVNAHQAAKDLEYATRDLPYGLDIPQIHVDPSQLSSFLSSLERFAYFSEVPQKPMPFDMPSPYTDLPLPNPYYDSMKVPPRSYDRMNPRKNKRQLTHQIEQLLVQQQQLLQGPHQQPQRQVSPHHTQIQYASQQHMPQYPQQHPVMMQPQKQQSPQGYYGPSYNQNPRY